MTLLTDAVAAPWYGVAGSAHRPFGLRRMLRRRVEGLWRPVGERMPWIPRLRRPIFITGTGRSNTTFLAECLGEHPQAIAPPREWSRDWERCTGTGMGGPTTLRPVCPFEDGSGRSPAQLASLRRRLAFRHAQFGGTAGTRLVTHNPHLINKIGLIRAAFPDAVVIVTFRGLYSTVASLKLLHERLNQRHGKFLYLPDDPVSCWTCVPAAQSRGLPPARRSPGGSAEVLAEYWLRMYELAQAYGESGAPLIWCDHERFVADPSAELARIAAAAGLDAFPFKLSRRVDAGRNLRWHTLLTETERRQVDAFRERQSARLQKLWIADEVLRREVAT